MLQALVICALACSVPWFRQWYHVYQQHQNDIKLDHSLNVQCQDISFTQRYVEMGERCKQIVLRARMGPLWYTFYQKRLVINIFKENNTGFHAYISWVVVTVLLLLFIVYMIDRRRRNKLKLPYISII